MGHPMITKKKPTPNETVPCNQIGKDIKRKLSSDSKKNNGNSHQAIKSYQVKETLKLERFIKNCMDDLSPMVNVTPDKKRICLSKVGQH